jgi:folate-binding protein YgfZ
LQHANRKDLVDHTPIVNEPYRALRETAAYLDLSGRGKIWATGEDRVRLLHAMTSNHVERLQPGQGCYAFFLNPQGRILADVNLFVLEDRILLDVEPEVRELVYRHLDKFIIADDVALGDASDSLTAIAVEGPTAAAAITAIGAPIPEEPYSHMHWNGGIVARVSSTGEPGFRIFIPREGSAALLDELAGAGVVSADEASARVVRLEHGKPRYGEDIFDTTLPQETQQMQALHFSKGCYIGQEIVERIRSRGHVNRLLTVLRIETVKPPPPGTKLTADGSEAGEITSAAFSPALGKVVALGYLRAQNAVSGSKLKAGEFDAIVGL